MVCQDLRRYFKQSLPPLHFAPHIVPVESTSVSVHNFLSCFYTLLFTLVKLDNTGEGVEQDKTELRLGTKAFERGPGIPIFFFFNVFHLL